MQLCPSMQLLLPGPPGPVLGLGLLLLHHPAHAPPPAHVAAMGEAAAAASKGPGGSY